MARFRFNLHPVFIAASLVVALLFPGPNSHVKAQAPQPYLPQVGEPLTEIWRWHPIEVLSAKGVRSMTHDAHGHMWFGLNNGLIKYDGYDWTFYDQQPFLRQPVNVLFLSSEGDLYAGSDAGLLQYRDEMWVKVFPQSDTIDIAVSCIAQLPDGSIMAGVQDGWVQILPEQTLVYTVLARTQRFWQIHPEARMIILPDEILFQRNFGRVDQIFANSPDELWVFLSRNNDGRLFKFNPADTLNHILKSFQVKDELGGQKLANRNQLFRTSQGDKWLINGFYKSGILRKSNGQWIPLKLSDLFGGDELHTHIMEAPDGSIWIGGLGKIFVFKRNQWKVFSAPALPIPSSRIIFHNAPGGQIWIAGLQGDVFRLNYHFQNWITYKGLNYQLTAPDHTQWFISSSGQVVYHRNGQWFAYDTRHGLMDSPVRLVMTREGRVWAAGSHQSIAATAYLEGHRWQQQTHPALSWGIDPRSVFQDRQGSLWFGASVDRQDALGQVSGILQLKNPDSEQLQWRHHTQADGIAQHNVYGIGQSPDGTLWAGGTNLLRLVGERWRPMEGIEQLNEFVDIVHSRQNLWVGSRYYGLYRFDGQQWTQFSKNQGLPSNTIISIFEKSPNNVWVITDKDIARFDGQTWISGVFPDYFRFPREGGEISVSPDGTVWINKALREWKRRAFPFSITPSQAIDEFWTIGYRPEQHPPKTTIYVYSEKVDPAGNTLISWTGHDYWENTPANELVYSWRINNEPWSEFSPETSILLTGLKSGKYSFEVRARDHDFNIELTPHQINFVVSPPIWKQPWFIALVISFLVIIAIYETRVIQRNRTLSRLNESLTQVNLTLETRQEKIQKQKEKILEQKEELEKKTTILEAKNQEIMAQRDQLETMVETVEKLSNDKQRFFTNISHEFRTPLTLILGSIEHLLSNKEDNNRERLNKAYEVIQRSSKRILRLINQILEIRKIELGKQELHLTQGDIISFTREITMLFNNQAQNQQINLVFSSSQDALIISFDHDKIEKILFNLLSNAFKSTPPGGEITLVMNHRIHEDSTSEAPKEELVFTIKDTGIGIPAEALQHIFDRFYQAHNPAQQKKYDSSGIGLSYVKDLVEFLQGSIHVDSTPGEGTIFWFRLPVHVEPVSEARTSLQHPYNPSEYISDNLRFEVENFNRNWKQMQIAEKTDSTTEPCAPEKGEKPLVLIVEDEAELRKFVREILQDEYEILEADNGSTGLEKALEHQPDLIISDVMMPEMFGTEMCIQLKKNLATNHIPVILLTARTAPENKIEGYQTGADAYIEKPFNMEYLRLRISNILLARDNTREKVIRDLVTQPGEIAVSSQDDQMLSKIRDLLEENISDPEFDVESLSQQFYLSRCHFTRKIKQITGLSPKEIIDTFRLKRAGQILRQQKLSISEVAYMVGFEHPNSFTRAFRKFYNMTPTEYSSQN